MCCKSFWKRFASFVLSFTLSLCVVNFANTIDVENKKREEIIVSQNVKLSKNIVSTISDQGSGCGECNLNQPIEWTCFACKNGKFIPPEKLQPTRKHLSLETKAIKILTKPLAGYTFEARANSIEGNVLLRVSFLANGKVGDITPLKELPYGLTEQAIAAAKKIKFEPMIRDGEAVSVTKQVKYNFTIY